MYSHWSSTDLILFLDVDEDDTRTRLRERNASKDDSEANETKKSETKKSESNDRTNDETALWISSVKKISSKRVFERLTISFISVSDIMTRSLSVNDESDEDDCVASEDSKMLSEDVINENDDEARLRKKSTEIVFWFFSLSIIDNTFEKKKTTRVVSRFFSFSIKDKIFEKKRTTKIVLRFSSFSIRRATRGGDMAATDGSDGESVASWGFGHAAGSIWRGS